MILNIILDSVGEMHLNALLLTTDNELDSARASFEAIARDALSHIHIEQYSAYLYEAPG